VTRPRDIPFHRPAIGEAEVRAVTETLRSGWITSGPRVHELEEAFARYVGAQHAVAVNSGTAALHLALVASGIQPGEAILTSPLTFPATTEVALYCGARPLFVDVDPDTLNMDAERVEHFLSREAERQKVHALVPVHYAGRPCAMEMLVPLAARHGLVVIEDAAHALPAWRLMPGDRGVTPSASPPLEAAAPNESWRMVGSIGDYTAFSFYATKPLTTGEGGMITCDSAEAAELLQSLRLHGLSGDAWKRYRGDGSWHYDVARTGYKYNLPDLLAALGIVQLGRADELAAERRRLADLYLALLARLEDRLILPRCDKRSGHAWHLFPIRVRRPRERDRLIAGLKARGVGVSVHFIPVHLHSFYASTYGYRRGDYPIAEAAFDSLISLPLYPGLADEDVAYVVSSVETLLDHPSEGVRA
jgi:perosamine synthetase